MCLQKGSAYDLELMASGARHHKEDTILLSLTDNEAFTFLVSVNIVPEIKSAYTSNKITFLLGGAFHGSGYERFLSFSF